MSFSRFRWRRRCGDTIDLDHRSVVEMGIQSSWRSTMFRYLSVEKGLFQSVGRRNDRRGKQRNRFGFIDADGRSNHLDFRSARPRRFVDRHANGQTRVCNEFFFSRERQATDETFTLWSTCLRLEQSFCQITVIAHCEFFFLVDLSWNSSMFLRNRLFRFVRFLSNNWQKFTKKDKGSAWIRRWIRFVGDRSCLLYTSPSPRD